MTQNGDSGASFHGSSAATKAEDHSPIRDGLKIGLQAFAIFSGFALLVYATAQNLF
jgi:hypothetical protein